MGDLLIILFFLIITFVTGSVIEKIITKNKQREIALFRKPCVSFGSKGWNIDKKIKKVELVTGECVISGDYFKNFTAGLKNILVVG